MSSLDAIRPRRYHERDGLFAGETASMLLWTCQDEAAWRELETTGSLRGSRSHINADRERPYQWMMDEMTRRIGPAPDGDGLPVWAWYQFEGRRNRPDLRKRAWTYPGQASVCIEFEAPDSSVLLSDFELWHYVLNAWYLPKSEAEGEAWEREMEADGVDFARDGLPTSSRYRDRIVASWQSIFDLDWHDEYISSPFPKKSIQATLWEVRLDNVRDARFFRGR